ncbi:MAG: hypothetical protein Q4A65_02325 [Bacillota bacterium]|nr:hypothetical protein [Bacillota bacterium]
MIESIDNTIQILTAGIGLAISLVRTVKTEKSEWLLLSLSFSGFFLGDFYYQAFLIFYDDTPQFSDIPYYSWAAAYLFLFMILLRIRNNNRNAQVSRIVWLVPVFVAANFVIYVMHGDIIWSIIDSAFMCGLMWCALSGLLDPDEQKQRKGFYAAVLAVGIIEHGLWTTSCFWLGDSIINPYFWFDFLLSMVFLVLIPTLRKAVEE